MHLPLKTRLKFLRQSLYASVGYKNNVHLRLSEDAEGLTISFEGRRHAIPDTLRWKLYRWGWAKRERKLKEAFGVGTHFNVQSGVVVDIGANTGDFALSGASLCAHV